ncbi:hypothetical protein NW761_011729 [Fusarium oxysporum]|nr:hypothetical protein NW758_013115 [Fusarium oxysporum]KAJ4031279.1 hypothetical protein NW753_013510 [Fusarium oxysporum]KAJ4041899.1 hypothetical protein NW763_012223 [Fusarium oxysporum]KAJ4072689.1 hypothetical protein NW756_014532 [Fusarium oxysporum]KAJ4078983.1 hypothetical protein NW761_011729 [Fusarium oxysporum]
MHMLASFPSIRIGLMVGIGAGIPKIKKDCKTNKNRDLRNIRLGDVIVSQLGGTHGGVKQYDFGKAIAGGDFQPSGFLNSPPRALLNAVGVLRQLHEGGESDMPTILNGILENLNNATPLYECPGPELDRAKPSDSEPTSLKWNEAAKWGVIGIASAIIIPITGWTVRWLFKRYRNRSLHHEHGQMPVYDRQPAWPAPARGQDLDTLRDWIDEVSLQPRAEPLGTLSTDLEMQPLDEDSLAPQISPQEFGDDLMQGEWLCRMPVAHLRDSGSETLV